MGIDERLPPERIGRIRLEEERVEPPPRRAPKIEARREDRGIVHHEEVARVEEGREVPEDPVLEGAALHAEHEEPRFRNGAEGELAAGNVVTVEPGVYLPGRFGVRIEDLVLVTDDGHEVLTNFPKSLLSV